MNKKIKSMKNSFKYAIEGLYTGIKEERNF